MRIEDDGARSLRARHYRCTFKLGAYNPSVSTEEIMLKSIARPLFLLLGITTATFVVSTEQAQSRPVGQHCSDDSDCSHTQVCNQTTGRCVRRPPEAKRSFIGTPKPSVEPLFSTPHIDCHKPCRNGTSVYWQCEGDSTDIRCGAPACRAHPPTGYCDRF